MTRRRTYQPNDTTQRGIRIKTDLSQEFDKRAVHELSEEWAAAITLWMATGYVEGTDQPQPLAHLREYVYSRRRIMKAKDAIQSVREHMAEYMLREALEQAVAGLPPAEKAKLLSQIRGAKTKRDGE